MNFGIGQDSVWVLVVFVEEVCGGVGVEWGCIFVHFCLLVKLMGAEVSRYGL